MSVYVVSDLHGVPVRVFQRLLATAGFGKDDFCFVLGDVVDRGEHGVALLKYMMLQPNMQLLLGNHEAMMLDCAFLFNEVTEDTVEGLSGRDLDAYRRWMHNGAEPTLRALRKQTPEMREAILAYVKEAPLFERITVGEEDFVLVHAGLPSEDGYGARPPEECTEMELLWTRPHLTDDFSFEYTTVFGHTPTGYFGKALDGKILRTRTWVDIDVGAAYGRAPAMLRLDDMREFYLDK